MKRLIILVAIFCSGCGTSDVASIQPAPTQTRQLNKQWVKGQIELNEKVIKLLQALQQGETRTINFSKLNK